MATTKTRKPTAAAEYTRLHTAAATLLARLDLGLAAHSDIAATKPKQWGYVGDLEEMVDRLQDMVDSLYSEGEYEPANISAGRHTDTAVANACREKHAFLAAVKAQRERRGE